VRSSPGREATGVDLPEQLAAIENPNVPQDEKWDINSALVKDFIKGISVIPADEILAASAAFTQSQLFAHGQWNAGYTDDVAEKAVSLNRQGIYPVRNRVGGYKSYLFVDQLGILSYGQHPLYVEKMSPFGFLALKSMVDHVPILNAVITTIIREINQFSTPFRSHDEHPLSFTVVPKGKKLGDKFTKDEEKNIDFVSKFILNCGDEDDPRIRKWTKKRQNMTGFIAKMMRDSLTMDACPIETELSRNGKKLSGLYNVPGETVRIAHEEGYEGNDQVIAVQVVEDRVVTLYTPSDIIYEVRNPRTDLTASQYGTGETEMFVRLVTGFLNALNYNMAYFDRNNLPRGILNMFGNFDNDQLGSFKRSWNAMLSGPAQRWKIPVMTSQDKAAGAVWTPLDPGISEMQFAKWITLLVSIICAIWGVTPEYVNLDSFTSRNSSPLSGNDTAEKLASSKNKSLESNMSWIEGTYNEFVIPMLNDNYEMHYVGLHQEDAKNIWEAKKLVRTVDELRKSIGDEEHEDPMLGEAPVNPALMAVYMQKLQQEQMEAAGEEGQYGLPQDVIDRLKEDGGPGGGKPGMGGEGEESDENMAQPLAKMPGQDKLGQAEKDIKKATEQFRIFQEIKPKTGRDRDEGWTLE
jgi:hypothetical protein